jgi:hypothetical protein
MSIPQLRASCRLPLAALALCALAACVAPEDRERSPVQVLGEQKQRAWDELNAQKAQVEATREVPLLFATADGELTVRDWHLEGGPGWEYVRARFTYTNTTDVPMAEVLVELRVLDGLGAVRGAGRIRLVHPFGWPLRPGTEFGEELRALTNGAHLEPGWRWTMSCTGMRAPADS